MGSRVYTGRTPVVPQAPPEMFNIAAPSATTGFQPGHANSPAPTDPFPGFEPKETESDPAASRRVINQVVDVAQGNGQSPARNT